jgi:hypothetical protein
MARNGAHAQGRALSRQWDWRAAPAASLENVADRQRALRRHVAPVPPAAAERLEQGDGIGVTGRFGLGQAEQGLPIGLLRVEQCQIMVVG